MDDISASKKGKNFSGNNVTGKRKESDFYETPYSMTRKFLQAYPLPQHFNILEPACGNKAIVKVLEEAGYGGERATGFLRYSDLSQGINFLTWEYSTVDWVITNPPFSIFQEWVKKCKEVSRVGFSLLLPLSYLHGQKRYDEKIFRDPTFPLTRIYVFTRYPMLGEPLRDDGKYNTGMMAYMWGVWEKATAPTKFAPPPRVYWIDNNEDIFHKEKKGEGNAQPAD